MTCECDLTIAIVLGIPEGIVFAAESRQTYSITTGGQAIPRIGSDFGKKVFELAPRIGALTFGWAFLLRRNISSHIEEFKRNHQNTNLSIKEIAQGLTEFFMEKYTQHIKQGLDSPGSRVLGFYVGGYDATGGMIYQCYIPENEVTVARDPFNNPGVNWHGQTDIVVRLLKGFDPRISSLSGFTEELGRQLNSLEYITNFPNMTLQDAVDYAIFLIKTTIDMQRFSNGIAMAPGAIPGCGGPIDVAVIQPNSNLLWIQQKELRGERTTGE